jgi:hypothetical protein
MKIPSKILKAKKLICKYAKEYDSEFNCSKTKDANNNEYLYLHFKPRDKKSSFAGSICILNEQKIRYAVAMQSDWKSLIFIPINQKLNYLVHSFKEVYPVKVN